MKIYLAGSSVDKETDIAIDHPRLISYYHLKNEGFGFHLWRTILMKNKKVDLFLDSGAFSAWSQGIEIDIYDYINFIKKHQNVIDVHANLDSIKDVRRTWQNQMIMERACLSPLPVFHYGEPVKWLNRYLKRGYKYIALGGMVPVSSTNLILWLDNLFSNYLCSSNGIPKVKVHGFGLTSLQLMFRYPWYSVDSTSWVVTGRLGSIYVPRFKNGQWIYNENSWKISVSNRSPNTKEAGKHIETLSPIQKQIVLNYIHEKGYKLGKSVFAQVKQSYVLKENERWAKKKPKDKNSKRSLEIIQEPGISNQYQLRDELNVIYFLDLEKSMPKWPWAFKNKNRNKALF